MNPFLSRALVFFLIVIAAMIIILAVASVSHAAECEPPPKLFFIFDVGPECPAIHHRRHHHARARVAEPKKAGHATPLVSRTAGAIPATGTYRWKNPEHEKLFEEFERWRLLGSR